MWTLWEKGSNLMGFGRKGFVVTYASLLPRSGRYSQGRLSTSVCGVAGGGAWGMGNTVHGGSIGFCVDVALGGPGRGGEVTIGVVCDSAGFRNGEDPVERDLFRPMVHEAQGWKLERVWTPPP